MRFLLSTGPSHPPLAHTTFFLPQPIFSFISYFHLWNLAPSVIPPINRLFSSFQLAPYPESINTSRLILYKCKSLFYLSTKNLEYSISVLDPVGGSYLPSDPMTKLKLRSKTTLTGERTLQVSMSLAFARFLLQSLASLLSLLSQL